ncbi:multisubstrate pseudouridine synthase 7 [Exophiala xenobiotica]|uniref:Multisubstrate pseudouridine synthase 7 n=1 Tax=Vermiconidia calcicola TaxID=1690605 RepID=A0AAV9Q7F9_9PEZI|nr:multisubstrate pseudouridine synthase 7 [Exophiala xenobiotica]KAK5534554.1 multisubstrate pseudouridine synthase 7 [Vermiconidia calcicola]KAK5544564.1 multisubstrate pseudouridine synthase 7 [Chaetothyriales sp. CCFEE 6169]KAK5207489.1 multisubstrate pseudouridine synthase 7 [Exophiala xenobiotica]KAK5228142.1 multisubstrate pseudouridine synthase 7 [Exophiala xenobiotica]
MDESSGDSRPLKRVKLDDDQVSAVSQDGQDLVATQNGLGVARMADTLTVDDSAKELQVGITAFVDPVRGVFKGVLKKRYTDFLVNEILPDGRVLHLQSMDAGSSLVSSASAQNGPNTGDANKETVTTEAATIGDDTGEASGGQGKVRAEERAEDDAEGNSKDVKSDVSDDDRAKLVEYFNEEAVVQLISLYESILRHPKMKARDHPTVRADFTSDRNVRSQIHQDIRRIFHGKIDSSTDNEGVLVLTAVANSNRGRNGREWSKPLDKGGRPGKLGWLDRGGEYVHFTLYKENKDTLEVISYMTKQIKTNSKTFQFAGTKDRRAVTVQRCSAYRVEAECLARLNRSLRYAAVGDFKHEPHGLGLGDLSGNEFVITLRDCSLAGSEDLATADKISAAQTYLSKSLQQLRDKGLLNYYGLQRFGTFAQRTDVVGVKILQGDYKGACDAILDFSTVALQDSDSLPPGVLVGQDDRARAEGIDFWKTTGKVGGALDKIPRRFCAETALIRHFSKNRHDHLGALLSIQRNLRLMYVHAYQSYVWNLAAGQRWQLFGDSVVEGDLVLVQEHKDKEVAKEAEQKIDADGEVIIQPGEDDRAYDPDDVFERARVLTSDDVASGKYSIFDIVLPLPGYDVLYPANACGEWYKTFMASEDGGHLDPHDMRRKQRDFSLSGGYRKILARIGEDFDVHVHEYVDDNTQFVETDMDRLKGKNSAVEEKAVGAVEDGEGSKTSAFGGGQQPKLAAVLKFQLGSSQYATMLLRELSKGGIQAYKADFMGGR